MYNNITRYNNNNNNNNNNKNNNNDNKYMHAYIHTNIRKKCSHLASE